MWAQFNRRSSKISCRTWFSLGIGLFSFGGGGTAGDGGAAACCGSACAPEGSGWEANCGIGGGTYPPWKLGGAASGTAGAGAPTSGVVIGAARSNVGTEAPCDSLADGFTGGGSFQPGGGGLPSKVEDGKGATPGAAPDGDSCEDWMDALEEAADRA